MIGRAALLVFLAFAAPAMAADAAWPPPPETQSRIEALRRTLGDAASTAAERQAAREELVRLLMHPSASAKPLPAMPARAAVDPLAPAALPAIPAPPATPRITPVAPPAMPVAPIPDNRGGTVVPSGKNVIDPRTGAVLIDTGNGWVDPATGRFVPRN